MCASLLAVAAQDVEDRLSRSALSSSHRQVAVGVVAPAAALASGAGTRSRSTLRPCRGSIALAVRALKTRDGSRQKNDPFKEFEDLRTSGAFCAGSRKPRLWKSLEVSKRDQ